MLRTVITAAVAALVGALVAAIVLIVARPAPIASDRSADPAVPTIRLEIQVIDGVTGEPVVGTIAIGDQVVGTASSASVEVPAVEQIVTVTAPGYELYQIGIRPHVRSDKVLTMPVRLVPRQPDL